MHAGPGRAPLIRLCCASQQGRRFRGPRCGGIGLCPWRDQSRASGAMPEVWGSV